MYLLKLEMAITGPLTKIKWTNWLTSVQMKPRNLSHIKKAFFLCQKEHMQCSNFTKMEFHLHTQDSCVLL